jgi:hypothetical protein
MMSRFRPLSLSAFVLCLFGTLATPASPALAHGTGWSQGTSNAVVLTFYYVGGGPMSDADARIFAPGSSATAFQTARTDQLGRLVFVPDRSGAWRVTVIDAQGHEVIAAANVTEAGEVQDPTVGLTGALLLSLTANLFLAIALWRRRRNPRHLVPQGPEASVA